MILSRNSWPLIPYSFAASITMEKPLKINKDSPPPRFVEQKKDSSNKMSSLQSHAQTAISTLQSTDSEEATR